MPTEKPKTTPRHAEIPAEVGLVEPCSRRGRIGRQGLYPDDSYLDP